MIIIKRIFAITIVVFLSFLLIFYKNNLSVSGKVMFSEDNKLYSADLNKSGKKLIKVFNKSLSIDILDYNEHYNSLLIASYDGKRDELLLYTDGKVKSLYLSPWITKSKDDDAHPSIMGACFGKNYNDILLTVREGEDKPLYLYRINITINEIHKYNLALDEFSEPRYSASSDSCVLTIGDGEKSSIYLYNLSKQSGKVLVAGSNPIWLTDGKSFIYLDTSDNLRIYDIENTKNVATIRQIGKFNHLTISPDRKYLIEINSYLMYQNLFAPRFVVISLNHSQKRTINYEKQFNTNLLGIGDITWVK